MGQEIVHRSGDRPTPLWSTQVMVDHPGIVRSVHGDYFDAGSTIATTNSYAVHHDRLIGTPLEGQLDALIDLALAEAKDARDAHGGGRIAGSIGPLIASYRPDIHPPHDVAAPRYAEVAKALAKGCDLLICETVASVDHARAVLDGAHQAGLPVWLSLTVDDADGTRLRSGEALGDAMAAADGADAILINCSRWISLPKAASPLVPMPTASPGSRRHFWNTSPRWMPCPRVRISAPPPMPPMPWAGSGRARRSSVAAARWARPI